MNDQVKKIPEIAMSQVESSQLHAIGHHPESNTLAIQFKGKEGAGSTYHYSNFSAEDFAAFQKAESFGAHFGKHIKTNTTKHPYKKIS